MPGKSTQDWADDAAFWDDAWADMEQRLDGKQRRPAGWWRWFLPLVLLVAGGVTAYAVSERGTTAATKAGPAETLTTPPVTDAPLQVPIAVNQADARVAGESTEAPQDAAAAPPQRSQKPFTAPAAAVPLSLANVQNRPRPQPEAVPAVPRSNPRIRNLGTASAPANASPMIVSADVETASAVSRENSVSVSTIPTEPKSVVIFTTPLPTLSVVLPPQPAASSPQPAFGSTRKVAYGLAAGTSLSPGMNRPGGLIGGYAALRPDQRVSFTVGLRYRLDELRIDIDDGDSDNFDLVGAPVTGDTNSFDLNVSSQTVGDRRLDRLTLSGLEVTGGAAVRIGKRLRLNGTLGAEYLLSARGLAGLNYTGNGLSANYVTNTALFSRTQDELADAFALNDLTANAVNRPFGSEAVSGFNRWLLRVEASVEYDFSRRLTATAGYSRLLTPVYNGGLLRARPGQFGVGVKFRLR